MSSNRTALCAAMAAALTAGSLPAQAHGISKKQVRNIVKQEVVRIIGPAGPSGPAGPQGAPGSPGGTGPAGMDGMPFLFALVTSDGFIRRSNGITNANIRREDGGNITRYCFFDLPPIAGGQVTFHSGGGSQEREIDLNVEGFNPDCTVLVQTSGINSDGNRVAQDEPFYILLY